MWCCGVLSADCDPQEIKGKVEERRVVYCGAGIVGGTV